MNLKDLLAKIDKGEKLTDEERTFLAGLEKQDAPAEEESKGGAENRIPKARLDAEIGKRKEAETAMESLKTQLEELTGKLQALEDKDLTEQEKLKKESERQAAKQAAELAKATKERDEALARIADFEFKNRISDIAEKHGFIDPEYLGYRLKQGKIELDKDDSIADFIAELEKAQPALFKSSVRAGGGTASGNVAGAQGVQSNQRYEELQGKKELSQREVAEFIALQSQKKESNKTGD